MYLPSTYFIFSLKNYSTMSINFLQVSSCIEEKVHALILINFIESVLSQWKGRDEYVCCFYRLVVQLYLCSQFVITCVHTVFYTNANNMSCLRDELRHLDSRQSISRANTQRTGNIFTERAEGGFHRHCEMERKKINGCKLEAGMAAIDPELKRRNQDWLSVLSVSCYPDIKMTRA